MDRGYGRGVGRRGGGDEVVCVCVFYGCVKCGVLWVGGGVVVFVEVFCIE